MKRHATVPELIDGGELARQQGRRGETGSRCAISTLSFSVTPSTCWPICSASGMVE